MGRKGWGNTRMRRKGWEERDGEKGMGRKGWGEMDGEKGMGRNGWGERVGQNGFGERTEDWQIEYLAVKKTT